MMNKYWRISYKTYENETRYASVVCMSVNDAIAWATSKFGIDANQILSIYGDEVEVVA